MTNCLDEETKKRLGLDKAHWKARRMVQLPEPVSEGRAVATCEVPLAPLIPDRLQAWWVSNGIEMACPDQVPIRLMVVEGAATDRPSAFSDRIFCSLSGKVVVERADKTGAVLSLRENGIQVDEFALPGEEVQGFVELNPDLSPIRAVLRDPWLRDEVGAYDVDGWSRVIGCGIFLRYFLENLTPEERNLAIQAVLRGEEPEAYSLLRQVLRGWGLDEVETVVNHALSEAHLLRDGLEHLRNHCEPSDPLWVAEFVRVCAARDDLECVRELLGFLKNHDLDESLQSLDDDAWRFIPTIPVGLNPYHPRLLRALAREVDAWWTWPVQDPNEYDLLNPHHDDEHR